MIFFVLLSISATISWFRFCPKKSDFEKSIAYPLLLAIIFMLLLYSSGISRFGFMITSFAEWRVKYYQDFGLIPAWLNITHYVVDVIYGITATSLLLLMVRMKDIARLWLLRILPIGAFTQGIGIYGLYMRSQQNAGENTLLLWIMTSLLVHAGLYLWFDSKRVKEYFEKAIV